MRVKGPTARVPLSPPPPQPTPGGLASATPPQGGSDFQGGSSVFFFFIRQPLLRQAQDRLIPPYQGDGRTPFPPDKGGRGVPLFFSPSPQPSPTRGEGEGQKTKTLDPRSGSGMTDKKSPLPPGEREKYQRQTTLDASPISLIGDPVLLWRMTEGVSRHDGQRHE